MSKTILITGASGLIGQALTKLLIKKGYKVHQLSRDVSKANDHVKIFKWNVSRMEIDRSCLENVDTIINLAGEGIASKAWTKERKQQIVNSRTGAINLLFDAIKNTPDHTVKTFISSSAAGHYGDRKNEILDENSEPGTDFLANTCLAWERAAYKMKTLGIRLVIFRTGVVLSKAGGALPQLSKPIKLGFGSALGSGKQWVPWIHIDDTINMFLYALEHAEIQGVYNMCAPFPVTNKELTKAVANKLHKHVWLPPAPAFILRIILGEMSRVVLNSNRTSADKIIVSGYRFRFPKLEQALADIYT